MRTRQWRRYKMEIIVKRRLKKFSSNRWWGFSTPNGDKLKDYIWSDEIGSHDSNFYKSHTTNKYESRYARKYSPNRKYTYYRDLKPKGESFGTREKDRSQLLKILKENGLK
jgi:hypothetical protein